jgi:glycosyltransferase involved in cell wall biosynthesis
MKNRLTIFFSNSISAPKWGGGEKWMITAATGLKKRGHRVILSGKAKSVLLQRAREAGLEVIPLNIYADYSPFKIWYTKRILKREQVDVIVLNLNKDIRVAGLAARWAKVPVILARNGIQLISDKWKHKKTMGLVDGIITNSETIRAAYNAYSWMPKDKTKVIYNGISVPNGLPSVDIRTLWNIPEDHTVFLAAGRLTGQKGFDLLVEAVAGMKKPPRPFTVLIAGRGKQREQLMRLTQKRRLNGQVKFIGFQSNLLPILKAADFIIITSRQEGMPNVVMEGMALGKPVLAARVNGVPELMDHGKTGFIFEPFNIEAIRNAMVYALEHQREPEIQAWGSAAREHIRTRFPVEKMLDELENYFFEKYAQSLR